MELFIRRKHKKFGYEYEINNCCEWEAKANYTYGILFRNIILINGMTKDVYSFKEKSPLLIILKLMFYIACIQCALRGEKFDGLTIVLAVVSITGICVFAPFFKYYRNDDCFGKSKTFGAFINGFEFLIDDHIYQVQAHSDFKTSITKDGVQIGLVMRNKEVIKEQNEYRVLYDKTMDAGLDIVILLSLFIDTRFYSLNFLNFSFYKHPQKIRFIRGNGDGRLC